MKEQMKIKFGGEEITLKKNKMGIFQGKHGLRVDPDYDGYIAYLQNVYLWQYEGSGKKPQTAVNHLERQLRSIHTKLDKMLFGEW